MVRDTPNAPGASARSPLSDRVCDAAVLGFGLWTLCCHAVVFAGGSLHALLTLYALSAAGLIALWLWARGRYGAPLASPRHLEPEHRSLLPDRALDRIQLAGLALAAAAALACYGFGGALALWIAAVGLLGLAAVPLLLLRPARLCPPAASRTAEGLLWSLAAGCVLATAIVHRPDLDDAFYVNLAVAAADAPAAGLLSSSGTLRSPGCSGCPRSTASTSCRPGSRPCWCLSRTRVCTGCCCRESGSGESPRCSWCCSGWATCTAGTGTSPSCGSGRARASRSSSSCR
jgi:hypothetical protein